MNTIVCPALQTERLTLRTPERGDIPAIVRHCGDPRVALKTCVMPHPYLVTDATRWLDQIEREQENCEAWSYAVELKSAPGMVGAISLTLRDDRRSAEVGYWLGVRFWRRGYMTEALREILRHGFEDLRLLYITAWHMAGNPASGRVMQKARMRFENVVEGGLCRDGALHDKVNYGLFADEWRKAP